MLHDRLLGVLCLGAATLAATWGGNGTLAHAPAAPAAAAGRTTTEAAAGPAPVTRVPGSAAEPSTSSTAPPSSTTTAPAPTPTTAATTGARAGDGASELARRALLSQADLPAGFAVAGPVPPDGAAPADTLFERCLGADAPRLTAAIGARSRSATYARSDTGSVSASAAVFDRPDPATQALAVLDSAAARSCFEGVINARLARNPNLSQEVHGTLGPAPSPAVGDRATGYRFEVRLPAEDVDRNARPTDPPVRYVADFLFVQKGRTVVLAEFDNLRQPWVDTALKGVAASLVARL